MVFADPHSISPLSTIWYELHAREWPYKSQPAEAIIWQIGSGMKPNLTQTGMGKEISVSLPWPSALPPSTAVRWKERKKCCNADSRDERGGKKEEDDDEHWTNKARMCVSCRLGRFWEPEWLLTAILTSELQMGIYSSTFTSVISYPNVFGLETEDGKSLFCLPRFWLPQPPSVTSDISPVGSYSFKYQKRWCAGAALIQIDCSSFFLLLGHPTSLLGLQTRGATQLLQTGRFTGKVTQAESPPFPPRALLEVSWVCQMS